MQKKTALVVAAAAITSWLAYNLQGGNEGAVSLPGERQPIVSTLVTPFADELLPYGATPDTDFSSAPWLSAYSRVVSPEVLSTLGSLETAIPDPLVRARVAEVLIDNYIAAQPGGVLDKFTLLKEAGQAYGFTLCGDSRIICDTVYSMADPGKVPEELIEVAAVEHRSLGAAPRVFDDGINVSLVATHCNSLTDPTGCGALAGLAKIKEPEGVNYLLAHGIDQATLNELQRTLISPIPEEQAIAAAKLQALINADVHGTGHITVATVIGHDGSWRILDAFDETGKAVQVPTIVNNIIAVNRAPVSEIDAFLALGQRPYEIVLDATQYNIQDLMGPQAAIPGHTFKITARPQVGNQAFTLSVREVDQAIAGISYPLAHDWARMQWVIARSPEELALIRERLLQSDKIWQFLVRDGVLIEAVVNEQGLLTGALKFSRLADFTTQEVRGVVGLRNIGVNTAEVVLSQKTLIKAEKMVAQAQKAPTKWSAALENLKKVGTVALKVLKVLQPAFDAGTYLYFADTYKQLRDLDIVLEDHAESGVTRVLTTEEYNQALAAYPNLEPYLVLGAYETEYTQEELARSFLRLKDFYISDVSVFGGDMATGPQNENSQFFGMGISDLYKILHFDYIDHNDPLSRHKILAKTGAPLIYYPLGVPTDLSPNSIEYTPEGMKNQPFLILNPDNGEFLITGVEGEMIVPVVSQTPRNNVQVEYYLHLRTDNEGNIFVKCVGYKEINAQGSLVDELFAQAGTPVRLPDSALIFGN